MRSQTIQPPYSRGIPHVFSLSHISSYLCYVSFWQHTQMRLHTRARARIFHPVSSSFFFSSILWITACDSAIRVHSVSRFIILFVENARRVFRSFCYVFVRLVDEPSCALSRCVSCLCASHSSWYNSITLCGCSSEICSYVAYYVSDSYSVNNMNQTRVRCGFMYLSPRACVCVWLLKLYYLVNLIRESHTNCMHFTICCNNFCIENYNNIKCIVLFSIAVQLVRNTQRRVSVSQEKMYPFNSFLSYQG